MHDRDYVCAGCGTAMSERGCKIRCPRCGYFEDCGGGLTPPPLTGPVRRKAKPEEDAPPASR